MSTQPTRTQRNRSGSTGSHRPCAVGPEIARLNPADRPHLLGDEDDGECSPSGHTTAGTQEFFCTHTRCRARITVSPDGRREYGHARGRTRNGGVCPIVREARQRDGDGDSV